MEDTLSLQSSEIEESEIDDTEIKAPLPLPIELRLQIYREFIDLSTLDNDIQHDIKVQCIKLWTRKFQRLYRAFVPSNKLYNLLDFIDMMITDGNFDLSVNAKLKYQYIEQIGGGISIDDTATRYQFIRYIDHLRVERFLRRLSRLADHWNFYVRYRIRRLMLTDINHPYENISIEGFIIMPNDSISHYTLWCITEVRDLFAMTKYWNFTGYSQQFLFELGNTALMQKILEKEQKIQNGICEF